MDNRDPLYCDGMAWSAQDDRLLMENWANCVPTSETARQLQRTKRACDMRISRNKAGFKVKRYLVPDND